MELVRGNGVAVGRGRWGHERVVVGAREGGGSGRRDEGVGTRKRCGVGGGGVQGAATAVVGRRGRGAR